MTFLKVLVFWIAVLGFLGACGTTRLTTASAPPSGDEANAHFVDATSFSAPKSEPCNDIEHPDMCSGGKLDPPHNELLPEAEEAAFKADVAKLPSFGEYPYSGCHDRAHAVYLLLKPKWERYLVKIWGFAPAAMTAARDGWIVYPLPADSSFAHLGVANPHWRYHVAVAVRTSSGETLIIDPVVPASMRPVKLNSWLSMFRASPETVWTYVDGKYYSFNNVENAKWAKSRLLFNGGMFQYEGSAKNESWMSKNLSRDDVAARLAATSNGCAALRTGSLADAAAKLETLQKLSSGTVMEDTTCAPFVQLFRERTTYWRQALAIP